MSEQEVPENVLQDMVDYYRARASEYDEWFYRQGRYDHGEEANQRWFDEAKVAEEALAAQALHDDVVELAPGTGIWTEKLLACGAGHITAVDASPEMLAINRARLGEGAARVTYVEGDLFAWHPSREYDALFFGFWLSHVPQDRLSAFLATVSKALRPGGKVFFVDGLPEPTVTAVDQYHPEDGSQIMTRILNDGRSYEIVKNFWSPAEHEANFGAAGLKMTVKETPSFFVYGYGEKV